LIVIVAVSVGKTAAYTASVEAVAHTITGAARIPAATLQEAIWWLLHRRSCRNRNLLLNDAAKTLRNNIIVLAGHIGNECIVVFKEQQALIILNVVAT